MQSNERREKEKIGRRKGAQREQRMLKIKESEDDIICLYLDIRIQGSYRIQGDVVSKVISYPREIPYPRETFVGHHPQ